MSSRPAARTQSPWSVQLGALFAGQWNLEKFRPNRTTHWSFGVAVHHCNWTTANRY